MESIRAYRFRVYPDFRRQEGIDNQLLLAKEFYNLLLEKSISSYRKENGKLSMGSLNKFAKEIEKEKKYLKLYSQARCEIKYRVMKAFQNFFRRVRERQSGKRQKAGFPRFKPIDRYKSITYPQDNGSFSIEKGRLRVSRIGTMKIELHREIEGKIKTLTIKKEAGDYYAVFTTTSEIDPPEVKDTNPVGIDLGLNSFIAISDGTKIEKPKFFRQKAKKIARWQRIVARRDKGSRGRQEAKERLQIEWRNITSQSNDFMHKLSNSLVNSGYTSFSVEKLDIQNMVRNHNLAQAISNASWNRFVQFLSYKVESAGMQVTGVPAKNSTQECCNCGNIKKLGETLGLGDRIYHCNACGIAMDRDINAAIVIKKRGILIRAREGYSRSNAQGESVRPQKEAVLEELGTYPASSQINAGGSLRR